MKTFILDIEANELIKKVDRAWIIGWKVKETGEIFRWLEGDLGWQAALEEADVVVGHNVVGYDLLLLQKLFNYRLPKRIRVYDTLIMSEVLNYNRFPSGLHKLKAWGEFLGFPKLEFSDFSHYSPEMEVYWTRDLDLTEKIFEILIKEFINLRSTNPKIVNYLLAENAVSEWCATAELKGWPFNIAAGTTLLERMEVDLQKVRDKLLPKLGNKTVAVDKKLGVVEPKKPKWRKDGGYDAHTCKWFGVDEWSGQDEDRLVEGPYSRIVFQDLDIDSVSDVKIFLFRHGWVPLEYNTKPNPNGRGKINTSPKITEDSLECMEGDGKLYCDFLTTSSRVGILKGWLKNVDSEGYLHGECFTIGTPSMRARHKIIVNVPAVDSVWGPEMRALFRSKPGWTMIGTDSAGNQARGLAHYLKSEEYIQLLLHGDIHTFNANALDDVLKSMKVSWDNHLASQGIDPKDFAKKKRGSAKRVLYAFLFGAAGAKMWSYIFGKPNDALGKRLKLGFTKAVPGFEALLKKLENIFGKTKQYGDGYIPGIGGNRVYCDSFHKLLVYLLQACEKATCGCATMLTMQNLDEAGIPYHPLIFMHDEVDYLVPDEFAEAASKISKQAFIDGPKLMGVQIMDGESKTGKTWYDVH